jgi:hypothetical protein
MNFWWALAYFSETSLHRNFYCKLLHALAFIYFASASQSSALPLDLSYFIIIYLLFIIRIILIS